MTTLREQFFDGYCRYLNMKERTGCLLSAYTEEKMSLSVWLPTDSGSWFATRHSCLYSTV